MVVVDISNTISEEAKRNREYVSVVKGFVPVDWYPSAVALSPDNKTLLVANGKGLASRLNVPAVTSSPQHLHKPPAFDYIGRILEDSISFIVRPDTAQMAAYTEQVRRNSPYTGDRPN